MRACLCMWWVEECDLLAIIHFMVRVLQIEEGAAEDLATTERGHRMVSRDYRGRLGCKKQRRGRRSTTLGLGLGVGGEEAEDG